MEIEILAENRNFYWGILPELELTSLNESIGKVGFNKAINEHNFTQRFDYATDPNRANSIKFLFPKKLPYKVLEIGCGYGNLTVELAKKFDHIDSVDAVYQSLLFTKHRLSNTDLSNVRLFQTNIFENENFLNCFDNESYDLIVINGVLEWIGSGSTVDSPKNFQTKFLNTCFQKLKTDGVLFLAIENRNYPGWIRRDPHSKLPLTAIAPRKIANMISILLTQKSYRTYIYSYRSLLKLMKKSGFFLHSKFYVYHSYRSPKIIFQNNEHIAREMLSVIPKNLLTTKWRRFIRFGFKFNLIDKFIPTFTHIYQKHSNATLEYSYKFAFVENERFELKKVSK
jgi:SAM-dependent methyltransferase